MNTTLLPEEVEKFSKIADEWWDIKGKFRPLHLFNPTRISYIREAVEAHFSQMQGIKLLDIGCGGGLLSEPMARLGAEVTGVDASEKNIKTALAHSLEQGLQINYQAGTAEDLSQENPEYYDVILAMEVLEHVADVKLFLESCTKMLKPNGLLFAATLNRTLKSYGLAIVGAEYILRWLPVGTHDWNKFLKPKEISDILENHSLIHKDWTGVNFNPLTQTWKRTSDLSVNYIGYFKK